MIVLYVSYHIFCLEENIPIEFILSVDESE